MAEPRWKTILFSLSLLTQIGLVVAVSILIGLVGGRWLDRILGIRHLFTVLGILLGLGAGFFSVFRLVKSTLKDGENGKDRP